MADNKIFNPGINFLNEHPMMQEMKEINNELVIVDKEDWQKVIRFFRENPDQFDKMIGNSMREGLGGDNIMEVKI